MARLHIVCGNCGALATNDSPGDLTHKINAGNEYTPPWVSISCSNCSTVHNLSNTIPAE